MKGIGKTVVRGTTIEDFFIEVVDVIEGPQLLNWQAHRGHQHGCRLGCSARCSSFGDTNREYARTPTGAAAAPAAAQRSGTIPVRSRSGRIRELHFVTALPDSSELAS